MKKTFDKLVSGLYKGQAGNALVLVLVFFLLGSLTLTPLLMNMATALKTGTMYELKANELYTADAGIENGLWSIKYDAMDSNYKPYDYANEWTCETGEVNGLSALVNIENVWFPTNITLDELGIDPDEVKEMVDSEKLVITGTSPGGAPYEFHIKMDFKPDTGDNLTIKSIGVWLPQGFGYETGNSDLEALDFDDPCYPPTLPTHGPIPGGYTILWEYSYGNYPLFTDFPGLVSANNTLSVNFDFTYVPPADNLDKVPDGATAWVVCEMHDGSGDLKLDWQDIDNVPVAWDTDTRFYKITSITNDTKIEAYSSKSEMRKMGKAIAGDYVAIGNSLLKDPDQWGYTDGYRTTPVNPSEYELTTENGVPEDGDVLYAYLYWSGWRNDAAKQVLFNDGCTSFDNWDRSYDDETQTRYPTGDYSTPGGTWDPSTDMYSYVDEVGAHDGDDTFLQHGTSSGNAMFNFDSFSVPAGSFITGLTVTLTARDDTSGTNKMQPAIWVGGDDYLTTSTSTEVSGSYSAISYSYKTNPDNSNNPWTAEDINGMSTHALQAFGVRSADANPKINVTQVYATVTYNRSRWALNSGSTQFQGWGSNSATTSQRTLTLDSAFNLLPYTPTTVVAYWEQATSGNLESTDNMTFAFSGDGGSTWSEDFKAFDDDVSNAKFTYPVPAEYMTENFKMRFYINFNDSAEYVTLDNIQFIYMEPDTSISFFIDGDQVYFDGNTPATEEDLPLTCDRSYAMFNYMNTVPEGYSYSCMRDVTALVREYTEASGEYYTGNALYEVADVAADTVKYGTTKSNFSYAGWSLIIVYKSPETAGHYIYIRDNNFAFHPGTGGTLDFDNDPSYPGGMIKDFTIPDPITDDLGNRLEDVAAKITCFVVEGDNFGTSTVVVKDQRGVNTKSLSNPSCTFSPPLSDNVYDVWNGASYPGTFSEGVDIDTFEILWDDNIFQTADDKVYVDMYTNADAWNLVYFIISVRSESKTSGTNYYVISRN